MGERTFVTCIDASKGSVPAMHRSPDIIEGEVLIVMHALENIDRDILGLEEARKTAAENLQNLRVEFHDAIGAMYPAMAPQHGRRR